MSEAKMKLIVDIRYFESETASVSGGHPSYLGDIYQIDSFALAAAKERLVLKLREQAIHLPDFDHIYICLTPLLDGGIVELSHRAVDPYHSFYRYVDAGCPVDGFNALEPEEKIRALYAMAVKAVSLFAKEQGIQNTVQRCADEVFADKENAEIIFKRKQGTEFEAQVLVRILGHNKFLPVVRAVGPDGNVLQEFHTDVPLKRMEFIFQYGSMEVRKKSFTIKPKKNSLSERYNFEPLKFPL